MEAYRHNDNSLRVNKLVFNGLTWVSGYPLFLKGKKMQNMYILISHDVQSNFTIII